MKTMLEYSQQQDSSRSVVQSMISNDVVPSQKGIVPPYILLASSSLHNSKELLFEAPDKLLCSIRVMNAFNQTKHNQQGVLSALCRISMMGLL